MTNGWISTWCDLTYYRYQSHPDTLLNFPILEVPRDGESRLRHTHIRSVRRHFLVQTNSAITSKRTHEFVTVEKTTNFSDLSQVKIEIELTNSPASLLLLRLRAELLLII